MSESARAPAAAAASAARGRPPLWQRTLPWLITLACFTYLYFQVDRQAARQGLGAFELLGRVFASVSWPHWLALMIPYSTFFFLVDSAVVWRIVNWFNARVRYVDILPIRASAYIISILNEQIGKGVMAVYLNRRDGVPGWQVGSSMLFIMFCEFFYLLGWATLGTFLRGEEIAALPAEQRWLFHAIPVVAAVAAVFFALWVLYFRGRILPRSTLRERDILLAFRQARAWQYGAIVLIRSPALLAAVFVYTHALRLFGIEVGYLTMLGYLPVIFFGASVPGPFRAVAVAMWPVLFPDHAAQMTAFGLVQHNFFILFNAAIGLLFLRRANRELIG